MPRSPHSDRKRLFPTAWRRLWAALRRLPAALWQTAAQGARDLADFLCWDVPGWFTASAPAARRPSFRPEIDRVLEDRVMPTATYLALSPSTNPAVYGQPVDYTAVITADDDGTPTGPVDFYNDSAWLGSA